MLGGVDDGGLVPRKKTAVDIFRDSLEASWWYPE